MSRIHASASEQPKSRWYYYTGRDLADGSDLAEAIQKGYVLCEDLYGDPTDTTNVAPGDSGLNNMDGFKVTKPQTENVNFPVGVIKSLGDPNNPTFPQMVQVYTHGQVEGWTKLNATARTSSVPSATPSPLAAVADDWNLGLGETSSVDTPAKLSNFMGYALETANTSSTAAKKQVLLRSHR